MGKIQSLKNFFIRKKNATKKNKTEPPEKMKNAANPDIKKKDSKHFYNEDDVILEEFKHVKSPKGPLDIAVELLKRSKKSSYEYGYSGMYYSSEPEFIKESVHSRNKTHPKCDMPAFHQYYSQFSHMNKEQKNWYLYWRERVINGEYPDTDLSYIYVFVYELINYSFNPNAAFNISMLKNLYEGYKDRYNIKRFETLIADMLYEAGEKELGEKWFIPTPYIPPLYKQLKEKEDDLARISITTWKGYFRTQNSSKFFEPNKNKIYKTFKECLHLLEKHCEQSEGKKLVDVYFETQKGKYQHNFFTGMVSTRQYPDNQLEFDVENIHPTKRLSQEISEYYRLSENVTRILNGEKRQIKCDESVLPEGLKDEMISFMSAPKEKGRFKTVQKGNKGNQGSVIPPKPVEEPKVEVKITFDDERIQQLAMQNESLVVEVEKRALEYEDEFNPHSEVNIEGIPNEVVVETEVTTEKEVPVSSLENFFFGGGGETDSEDIESFFDVLTELEREFLSQFSDDLEWSIEEANQFLKSKGVISGVFISELNEKAQEHLDDNLMEEEGDKLILFEEFEKLITLAKENA